MKNLIKIIALLLVAGVTATATTNAAATNDNLSDYVKTAEQFAAANPLEKVYLHMDNTSYFVDDTLWFKAYAVNAAQNKPTSESEILHVELLNPEGVVVRTQKYRLEGGKCDGSLKLDKELLSGLFEIRAYTKAMLNFGDQNYFTRVFPIFDGTQQSPEILNRERTVGYLAENPSKKESKQAEKEYKKASYYNVGFYPEGGNMVVGLKSNVAFQIRDKEGELIKAKCKIVDGNGDVIASRSTHLGIGVFELTPDNRGYYMLIEGDKTKYELPQPLESGCVVDVEVAASNVGVSIASNMSEALNIAVMSQGEVLFAKECTNGECFTIGNDDLKEGVNQLVVYNHQGRELASRLFFVQNGRQPQLTIAPTKSGDSAPHARQNISFRVTDNSGKGVATDFSLSIYDSATSGGTSQQNIYTALLLSSELRGYIPNADYYFESNDAEHTTNLDLVMMVHGWSRYKWNEMSGYASSEIVFPYERQLTVYGRVFLQEWDAIPFDVPKGASESQALTDWELQFTRDQEFPTENVVPDNDGFTLKHTAIKDARNPKLIFNDYLSAIKNNSFGFFYPDFNGDLTILLSIKDAESMSDKDLRRIFILDSEYRPDERSYDYIEQILDPRVIVKEISDYPSITLNYYNKGKFSEIHKEHNASIFESVNNNIYTSLERFNKYHIDKTILDNIAYHKSYYSLINYEFTSTGKQLGFRKMPYGTVSYLSTMIDTRTLDDSLKGYVTTPLRGEYPDVKWRTSPTVMYCDPQVYDYVIDSTVIHTSIDKRMELYDKYKEHRDYTAMSISGLLSRPELDYSKRCPDYIVEHFGRTIDSIHYRIAPRSNSSVVSTYYRQYMPEDYGFIFQGFEETAREFYSPDYSVVTPPASGDHRRTLYWNPNVESDSQGNATVTFYNNSQGGSYTIDAQTISADGQIGTVTTD